LPWAEQASPSRASPISRPTVQRDQGDQHQRQPLPADSAGFSSVRRDASLPSTSRGLAQERCLSTPRLAALARHSDVLAKVSPPWKPAELSSTLEDRHQLGFGHAKRATPVNSQPTRAMGQPAGDVWSPPTIPRGSTRKRPVSSRIEAAGGNSARRADQPPALARCCPSINRRKRPRGSLAEIGEVAPSGPDHPQWRRRSCRPRRPPDGDPQACCGARPMQHSRGGGDQPHLQTRGGRRCQQTATSGDQSTGFGVKAGRGGDTPPAGQALRMRSRW